MCDPPESSTRALVVLAISAVGLGCAPSESEPRGTVLAVQESQRVSASPASWMATCSNTGCHGAAGTGEPNVANAATIWATTDPHADAYRALFRHESRQIVRKLSGGVELGAAEYRQLVNDRCATCHASAGSGTVEADLARGVGCDACHGPAESWVEGHVLASGSRPPQSMATPTADGWSWTNPAYGLRDLSDHTTKARVCAGCHVGSGAGGESRGRDVNHDLIAAGHPRLTFEYTSHLSNLPPHWSANRPQRTEGTTAWSIGQLVSADAALELLESRVESGPWPEFAEYGCASCHHNLEGSAGPLPGRTTGGIAHYDWGSWHFALLGELIDDNKLSDELTALRDVLASLSPARDKVAPIVAEARRRLRQTLAQSRGQMSEVRLPPIAPSIDWDAAGQRYCFLMDRATASNRGAAGVAKLFQALEPPADQNAPVWNAYRPDKLAEAVRAASAAQE